MSSDQNLPHLVDVIGKNGIIQDLHASSSGKDVEIFKLNQQIISLQGQLQNQELIHALQQKKAEAVHQQSLQAKDALILEWMHSNEAFKQLARNYGKKLGVSDEQRSEDFAHAVVDVAEDDPKFANTKMAKSMREEITSPKPKKP